MITIGDICDSVREASRSNDFIVQRLHNGELQAIIYFFDTLCDTKVIRERISDPFATCATIEAFTGVLQSELLCEELQEVSAIPAKLLESRAIVFFNDRLWALSAADVKINQPDEAAVESTIQGPDFALSENLKTNINLIRNRYPSSSLVMEEWHAGRISRTKAAILYDSTLVNPDVLQDIQKKLQAVDADIVQDVEQLEALITPTKYRLFPVMLSTERPDRIALNLAQGKVVILMQGTPYALLAPVVFHDFMCSVDDVYQSFWVTHSLIILRYLALVITVILPACYIAVVSYNPEIFRVQLAVSIGGSRSTVPYPSFFEVFIMLFVLETLIEASIRLPKNIGQAATTVGGLILGRSAHEAGLVSSIMIIVASAVAIVNFVIPLNAMSTAMRVMKYPFILLAMLFGITGILLGLVCFTLYLASMTSFGQPYFRIYRGEYSATNYKQRKWS
ncbi:spore germination protein [Paenibacillus thiaminolyticus]|uniref:Spore germination protein n=1 Tax=Paenibacillus thiaminolyticus TaxID=49283 RepID=A0AAP9DWU7_PANTH|nr:spore germination protein [Paenibacillus thiaminolyticus]MCY9535063.1 spore germination protein [Paenibacillus thiaminolyticus]MCY9605194.1 spore germination protein [Paenibacillus thiaminolyticus]MCY9606045.1 spore germination protein [Paenibacillus thiaminolyticus]MCY9615649.1 spore germination protein [Paenibacillus thiaminolyticus]MCY9620448.1 spore germination protein [Paenibacillus thiaminolyticus]